MNFILKSNTILRIYYLPLVLSTIQKCGTEMVKNSWVNIKKKVITIFKFFRVFHMPSVPNMNFPLGNGAPWVYFTLWNMSLKLCVPWTLTCVPDKWRNLPTHSAVEWRKLLGKIPRSKTLNVASLSQESSDVINSNQKPL